MSRKVIVADIKKIVGKRNWEYSHILSQEFQDFIDLFPNAVVISRTNGDIIQCNLTAQEAFGYSREEFLSVINIEDLVPEKYKKHHPQQRKQFFDTMRPRVIGHRDVALFALCKSGEIFPMDSSLIPLHSTEGDLALNIITDLTYVKSLQKKIEKSNKELTELARLDSLTGIPNRRCFDSFLKPRCSEAKRHAVDLSLLYIDLDKFKPINDNYGHDIGDELLIQVASRLKSILRSEDFIARIGGDEFCVVLPQADNKMAVEVSRKISKSIRETFDIKGHEIKISSSIGVCTCCYRNYRPEEILKNADKAMYEAKKRGGNRFESCCYLHCKKPIEK